MNLVCTPNVIDTWINDITRELDNYVKLSINKPYLHTYIQKFPEPNVFVIRFPGATRGYLKVDDDNKIIEIELYEDACIGPVSCYTLRALKLLNIKKYIGATLDFTSDLEGGNKK